jgi:hypothetical protein
LISRTTRLLESASNPRRVNAPQLREDWIREHGEKLLALVP